MRLPALLRRGLSAAIFFSQEFSETETELNAAHMKFATTAPVQ